MTGTCSKSGDGHADQSGRRKDEAGFTLVEVVVALAILSLALAVLFGAISNGVRQVDSARKLAQAGTLAQSLLARLGTELRIGPGQSAGEFSEGFRWRIRAEPHGNSLDRQSWPVAAYTVSVEVLWGDPQNEQSVVLNTLRLAPKESYRQQTYGQQTYGQENLR